MTLWEQVAHVLWKKKNKQNPKTQLLSFDLALFYSSNLLGVLGC